MRARHQHGRRQCQGRTGSGTVPFARGKRRLNRGKRWDRLFVGHDDQLSRRARGRC